MSSGILDVGRGVELLRWDAMQKAYEEVCERRAGCSGLVSLVWSKMVSLIWLSRLIKEDSAKVGLTRCGLHHVPKCDKCD